MFPHFLFVTNKKEHLIWMEWTSSMSYDENQEHKMLVIEKIHPRQSMWIGYFNNLFVVYSEVSSLVYKQKRQYKRKMSRNGVEEHGGRDFRFEII